MRVDREGEREREMGWKESKTLLLLADNSCALMRFSSPVVCNLHSAALLDLSSLLEPTETSNNPIKLIYLATFTVIWDFWS